MGGARYGEVVLSLLLFADDIVLVAESAKMLQKSSMWYIDIVKHIDFVLIRTRVT